MLEKDKERFLKNRLEEQTVEKITLTDSATSTDKHQRTTLTILFKDGSEIRFKDIAEICYREPSDWETLI